ERGDRPGAVLRERRGLRDLVRGQEGQVPGAEGPDPAEAVSGFPGEAGKAALATAVREIESASDAEVVIAVRPHSGSYRDADLLAGSAAALAMLAFLLFSPWEFDLE